MAAAPASRPADDVPITVVIPLFQMRHTIERAIASAPAQTHAPAEVIVVDDGSTDDDLWVPEPIAQARAASELPPPRVVDYSVEAVTKQRPFFPTTLLIDRDPFLAMGGFDGRYRRGQDMEFTARVAQDHALVGTDRLTARYVRGADPIRPGPRRRTVRRLHDVNVHLEAIASQAEAAGEAGASRAAHVAWRLRMTAARWAHAGDLVGVAQLVRVAPRHLRWRLARFVLLAALPKALRTPRTNSTSSTACGPMGGTLPDFG